MNEKAEFLYKNINRYDFYINSTNAKCSIVLAFNSLIIGTLLINFDNIAKIFERNFCFEITSILILFLIGLFSTLSIIFAFRVINPFLKSGEDGTKYRSVIFFGSVSKMSFQEYTERVKSITDVEMIEDLTRQAKVLADGLNQKMNDMQSAIRFIFWVLTFVIALIILRGGMVICPILKITFMNC